MSKFLRASILITFCLSGSASLFGQHIRHSHKKKKELTLPVPAAPDRKYIADYHKELTLRIFGSRKFSNYGLYDKGFAQNVLYRPNSPFNIGIGMNYRIFGINLGFNFPFINKTEVNGKTKFLDLQTHLYGRMLIFDVYLQSYKGFYLPNSAIINNSNDGKVYIRPDLSTLVTGISAQYLFNGKKFSFRGAFLQNELQLRSAGSPILGGTVSNVLIRADSSVIPENIRYQDYFDNLHFRQSNVFNASIFFGYGYTFVLPAHLFFTAAGTLGLGCNYTSMYVRGQSELTGMGTDLNGIIRFSLGYNSRRYYGGIHYVGNYSSSNTPIIYARQQFGSGNFRISIARRFTLKRKLLGFY